MVRSHFKAGVGKRVISQNIVNCKRHKGGNKPDNTERRNEVVRRDLNHWLPLIRDEDLPEPAQGIIKIPRNVDELWSLNAVHQANVLSGFMQIYRKGRKVDGDRYPNKTLWDCACVIQRLGRNHYNKLYQRELIRNPEAKARAFNIFDDSRYEVFIQKLNEEMIVSASEGLVGGLKKAKRTPIKPVFLRRVLELDWANNPLYLEYAIVINVMLLLAIRGGTELAEDLN